ncbi:auxin-binding protein ABP19b-like isoform X1 [Vicia villosa]|uniref:auxin-binding protein ABP19b-like isoform X1 n=2 Tax=Vicia villosa TaxID=3911 RepID=UPI00273C2750|nr:auxin-binding protein ABP19b-like isoform X1 [Vicia villosa]
MKIIHIICFSFSLLSSYTSHANSYTNDFCVANLMLPNTPSGYPCKPEKSVTMNDFVFHGFVPGNTIEPFNFRITTAFVDSFSGLNGLGISAARGDIDINGTIPMHTHPDATELLIIVKGRVTVGFITSTKVYSKVVKHGDIVVIPKGQLHFIANSGVRKAILFEAFTSSNPSVQILDNQLFGNNLLTSLIAQTTALDVSQIKKLKAQFGGSN